MEGVQGLPPEKQMGFGLNHNSLFLMVELNFCASAPLVPNIGGCFDGDGGFREGLETTHHSLQEQT